MSAFSVDAASGGRVAHDLLLNSPTERKQPNVLSEFSDLLRSSEVAAEKPVRQTSPRDDRNDSENAEDTTTEIEKAPETPVESSNVEDEPAATYEESETAEEEQPVEGVVPPVAPNAEAPKEETSVESDLETEATVEETDTSNQDGAEQQSPQAAQAELELAVEPEQTVAQAEQATTEATEPTLEQQPNSEDAPSETAPENIVEASAEVQPVESTQRKEKIDSEKSSTDVSSVETLPEEEPAADTETKAEEVRPIRKKSPSGKSVARTNQPQTAAQELQPGGDGESEAVASETSTDTTVSLDAVDASGGGAESSTPVAGSPSAQGAARIGDSLFPKPPAESPASAAESAKQSRLIGRVARAFRTAQDDNGEIKLRLSPPELGSLKLSVRVQDGALTARIEAETTEARNILRDNLSVLRERLAEQKIAVTQFEVELGDHRTGEDAQSFKDAQDRNADGSAQRREEERDSKEAPKNSEASQPQAPSDDRELNVLI